MGIAYRVHRQTFGWESKYVTNGGTSGTTGQAKRLEGIKIELTGDVANYYDVYYRVHAQTFGWLGWAKNGEMSGTSGLAKRLEAIQIVLVKKGSSAPSTTYNGVKSTTAGASVTKGNNGQPVVTPTTPSNPTPTPSTPKTKDVKVRLQISPASYVETKLYKRVARYHCFECGAKFTQIDLNNGYHTKPDSWGGGKCYSHSYEKHDNKGVDYNTIESDEKDPYNEELAPEKTVTIPIDARIEKRVIKEAFDKECSLTFDDYMNMCYCGYKYQFFEDIHQHWSLGVCGGDGDETAPPKKVSYGVLYQHCDAEYQYVIVYSDGREEVIK